MTGYNFKSLYDAMTFSITKFDITTRNIMTVSKIDIMTALVLNALMLSVS